MIAVGHGVGYWVAKKVRGHYHETSSQAIGMLKGGDPAAGVIYENVNGVSCTCHIAIDCRINAQFVATIFDYPFRFLGLEKIICPVGEGNAESIRLVSHMGFEEEARIKNAHPDGALLIFTMVREQCRFLAPRYRRLIDGQRLT